MLYTKYSRTETVTTGHIAPFVECNGNNRVFLEFNDKKYYCLKRLFERATSCERDQDATTAPERHR